MAVASLGGVDDDDGDRQMAGDREFRFRNDSFVVLAYEDFVAAAIGGIITAASVELARFVVEAAPTGTWRGCSCVELGSGCGLISGALARLEARVVATEQEAFLEHLRWNLSLNTATHTPPDDARCEPLDWGDTASLERLRGVVGADCGADAIFAANCVYDQSAVAPFFGAVTALSGPRTSTFICGVPKPSARMEAGGDCSVLDAFVSSIPDIFDCYFVLAGYTPESEVGDLRIVQVRSGTHLGAAADVGSQCGLSVPDLADGIWVLLHSGAPPPEWLRPLLKLQKIKQEG